MPKKDFREFHEPAKYVIRQKGNVLNVHSSRMMERVTDLKAVIGKKLLSPEELMRFGNAAGEFRASEQAMRNFSKGGGREAAALTAKFTRSGQLASGARAGTVAKETLKAAGVAPGSSFSDIAAKASQAFSEIKPQLKKLFRASAAEVEKLAEKGVQAAIDAKKSAAFKFIQKGDLPMVLLDIVGPGIKKAKEEAEFQEKGA